jgi:hypothetical protein
MELGQGGYNAPIPSLLFATPGVPRQIIIQQFLTLAYLILFFASPTESDFQPAVLTTISVVGGMGIYLPAFPTVLFYLWATHQTIHAPTEK